MNFWQVDIKNQDYDKSLNCYWRNQTATSWMPTKVFPCFCSIQTIIFPPRTRLQQYSKSSKGSVTRTKLPQHLVKIKDPVVERTDSSSVASTSTRKLRRPRKLELSNPTVCTCLFILFLIYIILCHTHRIGKNTALYKNADGICKSIKMRSTITCLADTTTLLTQAAPMILIVTATRVVQSVCTR